MQRIVDEARLKAESAEIEQMLGDLRTQVDADAWQQVEGVLERLVRLYGVGLQRALEHARSSGADAGSFDAAIAGDDLLGSLLAMHGLHPLTPEERVEKLVERLGVSGDELMFVWLDDGRARLLSALGDEADCALRKALGSIAPELEVEIVAMAATRSMLGS
jgi:hypothetical protein